MVPARGTARRQCRYGRSNLIQIVQELEGTEGKKSFTPVSKECLSLHNFSWNSQAHSCKVLTQDIFRTEIHSERSINSAMTGINLFTPLSKVRHCDDLHKIHAWSTNFRNELTYRPTEFHENPTNALVPDTRWQANEKTDVMVCTQHFVKNAKQSRIIFIWDTSRGVTAVSVHVRRCPRHASWATKIKLSKQQTVSVDNKNQLDVTFCILYFSSNSCSTCFGQPCVHHQELTTAWCYSLVLVCAVAAGRLSRPVGR